MEARKWNVAESIELTEWTKRFSKYAKSLPSSAIQSVPGKSTAEVLFGTSTLRHSAVHRLPTSAAGILNMLSAAITFAEALKDSKRAEKVAEIKTQLEASIGEIVQHQNLLERKLIDQFEDIARRRAELDELERLSIEEMLATDKAQRIEVGSAFESFLVGSQQVSNTCACSHTPNFDGAKADSTVEENIDSSWTEQELNPPAGISEAQVYDQTLFCEKKPHQSERLEENDRTSCHDNSVGGVEGEPKVRPRHDSSVGSVEEEPKVSELTLSTLRSKKQRKKGKTPAAFSCGLLVAETAPVLVDEAPTLEDASSAPVRATHEMGSKRPRYGAWNYGAWNFDASSVVATAPHNAAEEAIPAEEPCFAAPAEVSLIDETYVIAPEKERWPERTLPAEEPFSKESSMEKKKVSSQATLKASQAELIIEGFDDAEEHTLHRHDNIRYDLDDSCKPTPESDVAQTHSASAEDAEFLIPSPKTALCAVRDTSYVRSPPPSFKMTSAFDAAAPEAPAEIGHTIKLEILNGSKVLRAIVFIRACTRTAIMNEARAYCAKSASNDHVLGTLLKKGCNLVLTSLKIDGCKMDLSTYEVENLVFLVGVIEKTDIPEFTLRISEI